MKKNLFIPQISSKFNLLKTTVLLTLFFANSVSKGNTISSGAVLSGLSMPRTQFAPGIPAEHTVPLNTLFMSFLDVSQEIAPVREKIIEAFLQTSADPHLIFMVYDERQETEILSEFKASKKNVNPQKIKFIRRTNPFGTYIWARDFSPIMTFDEKGQSKLFQFDYTDDPDFVRDDQTAIGKILNLKPQNTNLRLEGGNLMSDEKRRLYISVAAIEKNTTPEGGPTQFEDIKKKFEVLFTQKMHASKVIWLPKLDPQVEITGHIDMYMRLLKNQQAVVASSPDPKINQTLDTIAKTLESNNYTVHRLQINNKMKNWINTNNVFPSYTNSVIVGDSILIPAYKVPEDKAALDLYKKLGYKVIQIPSENAILLGGSLHCLTYLYP